MTQLKRIPVGSPCRTSWGRPCKRALPRFVLSKSTRRQCRSVSTSELEKTLTCKEVHDARYGHNTHVQLPHQPPLFIWRMRGDDRRAFVDAVGLLLFDGRVLLFFEGHSALWQTGGYERRVDGANEVSTRTRTPLNMASQSLNHAAQTPLRV